MNRELRILVEASGSLVSAYMIKAIQEAGHRAVASDIDPECVGRYLADDFIEMPRTSDPDLWNKILQLVADHGIDVVIPSLDETLLGWSERCDEFRAAGVEVVISEPATLHAFLDKWETYLLFRDHGIPTPRTSLAQEYPLVKPRQGRGAVGVGVVEGPVEMEGKVSQELIRGTEYTIDVLCDREGVPVYISPRRRRVVKDGKSVSGIVDCQPKILDGVRRILEKVKFRGPINLQCFLTEEDEVIFIEINPRIAGGMALGFAASENWIPLIVKNFVHGEPLMPGEVRSGLRMMRYYAEVFVSGD